MGIEGIEREAVPVNLLRAPPSGADHLATGHWATGPLDLVDELLHRNPRLQTKRHTITKS